jgi:hypothetical protein
MCRKKTKFEDDDGRRIADMSSLSDLTYTGSNPFVKNQKDLEIKSGDRSEAQNAAEGPPLTKKETRAFVFYSLKMTLVISSVFIAAFAVFILFCIFVWFK